MFPGRFIGRITTVRGSKRPRIFVRPAFYPLRVTKLIIDAPHLYTALWTKGVVLPKWPDPRRDRVGELTRRRSRSVFRRQRPENSKFCWDAMIVEIGLRTRPGPSHLMWLNLFEAASLVCKELRKVLKVLLEERYVRPSKCFAAYDRA